MLGAGELIETMTMMAMINKMRVGDHEMKCLRRTKVITDSAI